MPSKPQIQHQPRHLVRKQEGVALIIALIIAGIVVSLGASIIYRQQIQIRLTSNISTLEQNYQYAYGMEDFAGTILNRSFEDQPNFVSLNDSWYSETGLVLPITGGVMTGKLHDLHARINVNSLIRPKVEVNTDNQGALIPGNTSPTEGNTTEPDQNTVTNQSIEKEFLDPASITKERLTRLIFSIDEQQEMGPEGNFAVILRDWLDNDQNNGQSSDLTDDNDIGIGAETPYYQSLEPAYFSANAEMISPTELRLIKNMQEKFYEAISNEISTLPTTVNGNPTNTPVNVNTASEKVLAALGFPLDVIETIIEERKETPYESIDNFVQRFSSSINTENDSNSSLVNPLDLDVTSEYFLLEGTVEINDTKLFVNSILWRNPSGQISVIMRDFSNPNVINKAIN